ncbi:MAG: hypothetical protein BGP13_20735 [Sphingobacteriales bacterium 40-81]|nr:MAG: hypothetical protein BGP13_20735 [Sphingobacteriales bacterium 40-81]
MIFFALLLYAAGFFFTMKNIIPVICTCLLISLSANAQQKDLGTWHVVNAQYNINKKWFVWGELQTRSQKFMDAFYYYEAKGGAGMYIGKDFSLWVGTGRYATYANDGNFKKPFANEEFRFWQQLNMNNYVHRIKFEHRYRMEQRWLAQGGYKNRYRYRLNAFLPLNNTKVTAKTFFLNAHEEIFLTNKKPHFERNRIFVGAGYMPDKNTTLMGGYLHQYDYTAAGTSSAKNFFQISLLLQFHHDETVERVPQILD